jgi:hypothetical protein
MYDAVNNLGFDLWKATANGNLRVYDIRVTREQARMYSVCGLYFLVLDKGH